MDGDCQDKNRNEDAHVQFFFFILLIPSIPVNFFFASNRAVMPGIVCLTSCEAIA